MKKISVNKSLCVGCGACVAICDEVFAFDDNGLSEVKTPEVENETESIRESIDNCPTNAIVIKDI